MGCLAFIASVLTLLFVPETNGVPMPESRKDAIDNQRYFIYCMYTLVYMCSISPRAGLHTKSTCYYPARIPSNAIFLLTINCNNSTITL